ncbi:uncharacterized protein TNCV_525461 [Trichonephila clavipes]|nr:uncharacterized protein TNCV_525461 [Trichonephila clavipes]
MYFFHLTRNENRLTRKDFPSRNEQITENIPAGLDCLTVLSKEFVVVDDDVCATPITADKDILELVQSSKNIIDADSDDENGMSNAAPVHMSSEMRNIIKRFQECNEEDVEIWMACEAEDCGFQMLNDDEIVTSVQEESDPVDDETDEDENNNNESSKGPSNADAFSALETSIEWYEQQSECCPTQLLLLKRIRGLAAKK